MSIMRCEIHDIPWDSDYLENCPRCENTQDNKRIDISETRTCEHGKRYDDDCPLCKVDEIVPNPELSKANIPYLIGRLESVIGLLNAKEVHMAIAKLLADISALKVMLK